MDGVRVFSGRHYLLAGRGTKAHCQRQAKSLRAAWKYVRIVPWNPFLKRALRALLDDYAVFVFEASPLAPGEVMDGGRRRARCISCGAFKVRGRCPVPKRDCGR